MFNRQMTEVFVQVERLLDSVDAVIYILDYTKLKTQEEADLLAKLKVRQSSILICYCRHQSITLETFLWHSFYLGLGC